MNSLPSHPVNDCLDIAIDHRLSALFKPITKKASLKFHQDPGLCLDRLAAVNTTRNVPEDEVRITRQFFNSGWLEGITIILLQPSNTHPYGKGFASVLEECPTYCFLNEAFKAVSCGTLQLGDGTLSIIDSAPFIRPCDCAPVKCKREMRRQTGRIICAKKPSVALCMWQDKEGVPSRMTEVQSMGVGKDFKNSNICFNGEHLERVSSFHPSYAANYNPHASCFRQLLLLNISQACAIYEDGFWHEEEWMKELKERCTTQASAMSSKLTTLIEVL